MLSRSFTSWGLRVCCWAGARASFNPCLTHTCPDRQTPRAPQLGPQQGRMQAMLDGDEIVSVRDGSAPNLNVTKDALGVGDWQREVRTPLPAITATATHRHHERASCRRGQPAAATPREWGSMTSFTSRSLLEPCTDRLLVITVYLPSLPLLFLPRCVGRGVC